MSTIQIAVLNASTVLPDAAVQAAVVDLQTQVHRDLAPAWGVDATLLFVPHGTPPPAQAWQLVILDTSDQAGALGYHDVTAQGQPLGKVFAKTDQQYGLSWTVTASHELCEMLVDPEINLTVFVQPTARSGTLYAYEVADPCEADQYGYQIGPTLVSDFVTPAWFEPSQTQGPFDYGQHLHAPLTLLPGGYMSLFQVGRGTGWHQVTAAHTPPTYAMRPQVGSRRERRRTPREQWLVSTR
jgi:hypothetical protein